MLLRVHRSTLPEASPPALNSAFANLASIEGTVDFLGQNDTITPGGTLTIANCGASP